jgi:hypothetical protein
MPSFYEEAAALFKAGKNPTVEVELIPFPEDVGKKPNFLYVNLNKTNKDDSNVVDSAFVIISGVAGKVVDGKFGVLGDLELTSVGYSSEVWFKEIGIQLNKIINEFSAVNGSNYFTELILYADSGVLEAQADSPPIPFGKPPPIPFGKPLQSKVRFVGCNNLTGCLDCTSCCINGSDCGNGCGACG